jgi:hypothetical protein
MQRLGKKIIRNLSALAKICIQQLHIHNYTSEDSSSVEASVRRGRRRVSISIRWVWSA